MNTYDVYCPEQPSFPREFILAATNYEARKAYADRYLRQHGMGIFDCVALRVIDLDNN